ncbi:helix-turn-helix transcriptional regulator [Adlercreutzia sp. R25]|uniref:Helix-turn-helix transcriptional regulator n=1 Tax=Adlercreutzia shanghongiae TaxID=3111773 RepID=A0ABU6IZ41_9ACTN|nr:MULTISPECIES: helix-turn-helix transcriptional regulator [unclassified Adlercreutzia]MEC4272841.1 helix-turn-helix transcriptional regulator [Adlercreutzia sp. R25]MEC4295045.1 helix-turn-helix transcriptional regulator [Adlercreutzia sp. R22]
MKNTTPADRSAPPVVPPRRRTPTPRTDRATRTLLACALASFGLSLMLAGAAGCIAAGAPAPVDFGLTTTIAASLAAACALAGLGMLLALRERALRERQARHVTRAEHIQQELDELSLTPKEMPVARLILQHKSYPEIAADRHLSVRTVQFHATNIFRKAYVSNRRDFERVILTDQLPRCLSQAAPCHRHASGSAPDAALCGGAPSLAASPDAAPGTQATIAPHANETPLPPTTPAPASPWFSARLSGCPTAARSRFAQHHGR